MKRTIPIWTVALLAAGSLGAARAARDKEPPTALDRYIAEAGQRSQSAEVLSPGSLYSPGARLADLARDPRASQVDDIVTVLVADKASAAAKGVTSSSRKSNMKSSVGALFGPVRASGTLGNLANLGGESKLEGQGETSRETTLATTLTARVTRVLANGYLVIEGSKDVLVNSERQTVSLRGVARPADLSPANVVRSDRLAQLEVRINGRGVVGDAIRRPFFLYRLLAGLLPF